jgi:biotin carboxyl carrier protein
MAMNHEERLLEGERLHLPERLIVADARGPFRPLAEVVGEVVEHGQVIGVIEGREREEPVVSRFRGRVLALLAHAGELVREGEPIACLHVM